MKRTRNTQASGDYDFFKECVAAAIRAGLDAMIHEKVEIALVARVSCGLYAGTHKGRIGTDFTGLVQGLLDEKVGKHARGAYFTEVLIPRI